MKNKLLIFLLTTFIAGFIGCAGSCKNNKISGTLYIAGNEPFTYLALDSKDRTIYKIECSDSLEKELWVLQGQNVVLKIEEIKKTEQMNIAVINGYSTNETDKE